MTTNVQIVDALPANGSYRGLRAILPVLDMQPQQRKAVQGLCDYAVSVLDLDAEDWGEIAGVPDDLRAAAAAAHVPQDPNAADRGALQTLTPAFAIMLEIVGVRRRQGDLAGVLMVCHIMSEYLPLLAWEPHLGHAADPPRMADHVTREGSLWGVDRDDPRSRKCAHSPSIRGSLRELIRVGRPHKEWTAEEHQRIWREYLDRDHSWVSGALATCGLIDGDGRPRSLRACDGKCAVWNDLPGDKDDLVDRLAIAGLFVESPLIALRHAAPVGHGFGVPSASELSHAWEKTWAQLTAPWSGGRNPLAPGANPASEPGNQSQANLKVAQHGQPTSKRKTGRPGADGEPLAGLAAMVSAVAGREIAPTTIFTEIDALVRAALNWSDAHN